MPGYIYTIKRILLGFLILSISLMISDTTGAEEIASTRTIVTIGSSKIYGENLEQARSEAISNSLIYAVAQATAELLPFDSMIRNFQVIDSILLRHTDEVIQDYKVLSTSRSGKLYRVMVQATVLVEKMEEQLSSVGIALLKKAMPKILLVISEQNLTDSLPQYWWSEDSAFTTIFSESSMAETMEGKGFSIIDHDMFFQNIAAQAVSHKPDLSNREAVDLGVHFEADVVIVGKATALKTTNIMKENTRSYRATMTARALRTDTGEEIGSTNQTFITMSTDELTGGVDALSGTGRLTGAELSKQIATAWQDKYKELVGIEMVVKGTKNLANFVEFRKVINVTPGVKGIRTLEMTVDQAIIVIVFEGTEKALADALMLNTFSSFGINIYEIAPNHLGIAFVQD